MPESTAHVVFRLNSELRDPPSLLLVLMNLLLIPFSISINARVKLETKNE